MHEVIEKPEAKPAKAAAPKMFKVTVHSGEDKGEKGDVFLAHNFKTLLIQRDQEVTIAEPFLECLKHTVIETVVKDENGKERSVKMPRFSFSVSPA